MSADTQALLVAEDIVHPDNYHFMQDGYDTLYNKFGLCDIRNLC